jgi:hypothetical protein
MMTTQQRVDKLTRAKSLKRLKNKVLKVYPDAYCRKNGQIYEICTKGIAIKDPELMLPNALGVYDAWERAAYCLWFKGMIVKSFNAFSDEKMAKQFEKEKDE